MPGSRLFVHLLRGFLGASFADLRVSLSLFLLIACSHPLASQDRLLPVIHFNRLTTADGLPSNQIRSNVVRDRSGFIWVGTVNGLVRYDGYTSKVYPEFSVPDNVLVLLCDSRGRLWAGKYASSLSLYDPATDRFVHFKGKQDDTLSFHPSYTQTMYEDPSGIIWIGTEDAIVSLDLGNARDEVNADSVVRHARFRTTPCSGFKGGSLKVERWDDSSLIVATVGGLFIVNRHTRAIFRPDLPPLRGLQIDTLPAAALVRESPTKLWIGTNTHGLFLLDQFSGSLTGYHRKSVGGRSDSGDRIQEIAQDRNGTLWIATGDGVDMFDPLSGTYREYIPSHQAPGKSMYTRMSVDSTGTLWIGTADDGLYYVPTSSYRFPRYALRGPSGLPMEMETINRWSDGSYWIGAEGKLVQLRVEDLKVLRVVDLFSGKRSGFERAAWASHDDGDGRLWIGSWGLGLFGFVPRTGQVTNYRYSKTLTTLAFKDDICRSIVGTSGDTLWIAAYNDRLVSFDTRHRVFSSIPHDIRGQIDHLMKTRSGQIWISDEFLGLFVADPPAYLPNFLSASLTDSADLNSVHPQLSYEDPQGRIWVGGKELYLWEPATKSFKIVANDQLANAIHGLPVGNDIRGRLWVWFVGKGLGILDANTGRFTNFDHTDGFVGPSSMASLDDGRVMLVGAGGMSIVHPDSLDRPWPPPLLVLSRVSVNDSVNVPQQSRESTLQLRHDQNVLEFEFAAVDPGQAHLIEYRYRLEGLEDSWIQPGSRRYVRYPGLTPGTYVFRVRAASRFGRWPEQEIVLPISIAPPWWRAWWAYALYGIFLISLGTAAYRRRVRQLSLKQRAEHLAEVDRLKSRFFANISHEFRTPLTLILGPIGKWKERLKSGQQKDGGAMMPAVGGETSGITADAVELEKDLSMLERNAHRLLRLINQLLDLSKLEAGAMKLHASPMNIVPLVKGLAYSFESSAGLRQIGLEVVAPDEAVEVYCDRDMLEKILSNLLSNAFKFTGEGGKVTVAVSGLKTRNSERKYLDSVPPSLRNGEVDITVSDSGVGIEPQKLPRIFDRFYQVDESQTREHEGSGIGLALVKELVELHYGVIEVRSEPGRGTEFTVRLPLGRDHLKDEEIVETPADVPAATDAAATADGFKEDEGKPGGAESTGAGGQKLIVLVVEDNADVRSFVRQYLVDYEVLEASDGRQGVETARSAIPDLIISDVMMPGMDGYELCRILKHDEKTCHIPVILLTAKAAIEHRIEGLETGADDYLIKPFEPKELIARVRNLIETRRKLRERFTIPLKPGEVAITSMDDAFLQRAIAAVEERMGDETFGIDDLRIALNMSHSQVHRKLTALTNQSPGEFIRYLRLHRAMDLLKGGAGTIAEIAYRVGFSDPSYFSRRFHQQFGVSPSEVRASRSLEDQSPPAN